MSASPTSRARRSAGTPAGCQFAPEAHAEPEVALTSDDRWRDDAIQFPRLIAEIAANVEGTPDEWAALCESMDISPQQLNELFERANTAWERAKDAVAPASESTPTTDMNGHTFWINAQSQLHRDDGPAIEWADGAKEWYQHGELHRDDGPAVEEAGGARAWYINGRLVARSTPPMESGLPDEMTWFAPDRRTPPSVSNAGVRGGGNWADLAHSLGPIEAHRLYLEVDGDLLAATNLIVRGNG